MITIMLVCLLLCSGTALAAGGQFLGAKSVQIVVDDFEGDEIKCGLDQKSIKAAADTPIVLTGLKEVSNLTSDLFLFLNVSSMSLKNGSGSDLGCVSKVKVQVAFFEEVDAPFNEHPPSTSTIYLFERGGLHYSKFWEHSDRVGEAVEKYLLLFAIDFNNDNK